MSDEDHEVDIESDEDDDENGATQFMTQAEKRAHHNALERKRRDHIKESFHSLRDSVPSLSGEKVGSLKKANSRASRAQILKQATDYIQFMSKKNGSIQVDIDDLKKQNNVLEQQVRGMEKTKTTGAYAAQTSVRNASPATSSEGRENYAESESDSDTEIPLKSRRKKMKTSVK